MIFAVGVATNKTCSNIHPWYQNLQLNKPNKNVVMNVAPHVMVIYTRGKVITNQLNFFSLNKPIFTNGMNTISIENYHIKGYFVFSLPVLQIQMGSTSIINVRSNFIVHSSKSKQIHNLNQFHHIFCCFFSSLLSQIFLGGEF